jgi:hypothetical protein
MLFLLIVKHLKYEILVTSNGIKSIPSFVEIGKMIQDLEELKHTGTLLGDIVSLLFFLKKDSMLITCHKK